MARYIDLVLPGDQNLESVLRVNHSGEVAAVNICRGQIKGYRGKDPVVFANLDHTAKQEQEHMIYFEKYLRCQNIRPSIFLPIWHALSYGLGYVSGALGSQGIMSCTKAVEDVISKHYEDQLKVLSDSPLRRQICKFHAEELEHASDASAILGHASKPIACFQRLVAWGCRTAIAISKRL